MEIESVVTIISIVYSFCMCMFSVDYFFDDI